jgi:hypothetical protein
MIAVARCGQAQPDVRHRPPKAVAILGLENRLEARPDQLDAVVRERPALGQLDGEIQGRLTADRRQQHVGPLPLENLPDALDGHGLDVGAVGRFGVRHDRGRIRVEEHDPVPLLAQRLARLGPGVVELASLTDHDRARSDHEDRLDVAPLRQGL